MYRSQNSTQENDLKLSEFINYVSNISDGKLILVGDFNFSDIDWATYHAKTSSSENFVETLRDNFLIQNVKLPTRARGSDTPHILDLVLTNENFIEDIDYMAPLGKSDHCVLNIKCEWHGEIIKQIPKLNYNKGDYEAFKAFLNIDWNDTLVKYENDVESMWTTFKNIIMEGTKSFIPEIKQFSTWKKKEWKQPLDLATRKNIKLKKMLEKIYN